MKNQSIITQIEQSEMAIDGVLNDPTLIKVMEPLGYSRKELLRGKALSQDASHIQNDRDIYYSEQRATTKSLNDTRRHAHAVYIEHVYLARMVVPTDHKYYSLLKLGAPRERILTKWLAQARSFYRNIHLIAPELEKRAVTAEELTQAAAMVQAVATARVQQNARKSNVQKSKKQRDAALEALNVWMEDFLRTARYAFAKNPQQLEALGIVV